MERKIETSILEFKQADCVNIIEVKQADDVVMVATIVKRTIEAVYPHYYPMGAVHFFLELHSEKRIEEAIFKEKIYLAMKKGVVVGTGSIRGNEICRLFILPEYQRNGYGSGLMDLLEEKILETYTTIQIDASFPAEHMYLKRGYRFVSYKITETDNGDFLCYHTMEKTEKKHG